jgi:hypothetical protein
LPEGKRSAVQGIFSFPGSQILCNSQQLSGFSIWICGAATVSPFWPSHKSQRSVQQYGESMQDLASLDEVVVVGYGHGFTLLFYMREQNGDPVLLI